MAISFAQSERSTLGVEWELQLIDVDSEDFGPLSRRHSHPR